MVSVVYNYIGSDTSLDGAMIEGIIGLFVILFLILVVPYVKDWYIKWKEPEYLPRSYGNHVDSMPPIMPAVGTRWANTNDNKIYIFNGDVWEPREGDVWFW